MAAGWDGNDVHVDAIVCSCWVVRKPLGFRQEMTSATCKYGDQSCPCQDGDACHYEGKDAWPPPKKPRGRPSLPHEQRQTERVEIRMTKAQRDKLDKLGGAAWIRERIDKARAT